MGGTITEPDPQHGIEPPSQEDVARSQGGASADVPADAAAEPGGSRDPLASKPSWWAAATDTGQRRQLVAELEAAGDEFRAALYGWRLDESIDGTWTVAELIGHLAAWLEEGRDRIPELINDASARDYDVDGFNAKAARRARSEGPAATVARHRDAFADFLATVEAAPQATLAADQGPGEWVRSVARHYREHATQLRAAASRRSASS
jgi:hypothetical protein